MNTDNGVSTASSAGNLKVDGVSDQFPVGLRVLVVDDDPTCLIILEKMLRNCRYEVTTCSQAVFALSMLRENKGGFDLVISDVYMPDMDGFKLLEYIGLEMDLPVIMMSADDGKDVVMKGVTHGACDYLIKPVSMEAIKNIWQHVIRKRRNELKELEHSGSLEDSDRYRKPSDDGDYACSANDVSWKHSKRKKDVKDEEDEGEERDDTSALKKPRVVWSVELHQQFVAAVNQLSIDKAVPKKILELMNVPGLTRENVASHLQKYRLYLRRLSGVSHQAGLNASFMGTPEATFGSIPSLDRLDFQALGVSGQLPQQNVMALQAGLGRTSTNAGIGMSIVDQMNLFNSEVQNANSSSKIRYGPGQPPSNNQVGLLQGLPTALEPKQLAHLHQPIQSFGSTGLQVSEGSSSFLKLPPQLRPTGPSHGDTAHGHQIGTNSESNSLIMQMTRQKPHFPLSQHQNHTQEDMTYQQRQQMLLSGMGPQMLSKEISGRFLGRNVVVPNSRGTSALGSCITNPSFGLVSQTPSVDYPINHVPELPGNAFPLVSMTGVSSLTSTGMIREATSPTANLEGLEESTNLNGTRSMVPSYDLFNELRQSKRQDWNMQNINLAFASAQHCDSIQSCPDFSPSLLDNQDFGAVQKNGQIKGMCFAGKGMVSSREGTEQGNQHHNNLLIDVKTENFPDIGCESELLSEHFGQDDLMDALFKQQEGVEPVENEFNIDGFPMDNIQA